MGFLDDAINSLGTGLAQSAVQFADQETGVNVGGILTTLYNGGADPTATGGDIIGAALAALGTLPSGDAATLLQNNFGQVTAGIAALGSQLTMVADEIGKIRGEIANIDALLKQIQQEQLYLDWQTANQTFQPDLATIIGEYERYSDLVANYETTTSQDATGFLTEMLNAPEGPAAVIQLINTQIVGSDQQKGVLRLWSEMVSAVVENGLLDYRVAVQQYCDYYARLAYAQLQATNLLMEASAYIGKDLTDAVKYWSTYRNLLLSQEDPFIQSLVPLVASGIRYASNTTPRNWSWFDASMQLHAGIQTLQSDPAPDQGYYAPSEIFTKAERLLANLYVVAPTDRRIAVHVLFPDQGDGAILRAVMGTAITIQPSAGGAAVTAVADTNPPFGPYDLIQIPADENFMADVFYVRRIVFSDMSTHFPDGTYNLTDLNDKLLPVWSYASATTPFQETKVLNYALSVSGAAPFDFMNCANYMLSTPAPINVE